MLSICVMNDVIMTSPTLMLPIMAALKKRVSRYTLRCCGRLSVDEAAATYLCLSSSRLVRTGVS